MCVCDSSFRATVTTLLHVSKEKEKEKDIGHLALGGGKTPKKTKTGGRMMILPSFLCMLARSPEFGAGVDKKRIHSVVWVRG